ncbi:MAG: response regulator [Candidatus Acidiferrales bacterium]
MRILIAEDNEASRELLTELLAIVGHEVVAVANGREALAVLKKNVFDVLLMDQEMPRMNGLATAREIRGKERKPGKRVAIIGVSGNATAEDEQACRDAGMDAFLAKPFDRNTLYRTIDSLPAGGRQVARPDTSAASDSADTAGQLRRVTGENSKLQQSLIRTFRADVPKKMARIKQAIAQRDSEKLAGTAHSLKGALGIFNAKDAILIVKSLEAMGRARDLSRAPEEFRSLQAALKALDHELQSLQQKPRPNRIKSRQEK